MIKCIKYLLAFSFLLVSVVSFAQTEICSGGIDEDGDGLIDCDDGDCDLLEVGCNCEDGIDNDGDGLIDIKDGNCANYYGLTFMGDGAEGSCSAIPDNADAGVLFDYMGTPVMTSQNTADTQTKVVVGDVDGDGTPDMVGTSKWNKEIRVIASTNHTAFGESFTEGDVKGSFSSTQNTIPAKWWVDADGNSVSNSKHTFELEVAIADIDGDGVSEIYSIMSTRNTPNDSPQEFYLVGFTYRSDANGGLIPLFDPVFISDERPGEIAIADFDGDGLSEVYFKNQIYSAEGGILLADGGGDWNTEIAGNSVAINLNTSSSNLELVCGNFVYHVPSLASRTLVAYSSVDDMNAIGGATKFFVKRINDASEYGYTTFSGTSVADIDADGDLDVFLTGATGSYSGTTTIFWWDYAAGTVKTYVPTDGTYADGWIWGTSRLNIGDVDGKAKWDNLPSVPDPGPDGDQYPLEITFIAGNRLFCIDVNDETGVLEPLWIRTINDSKSGIVMNTVYDFNNDGYPEVVYRDSQQLVVITGVDNDGDGQPEVQWAVTCQSHTMTEGPIIVDVDGNGSTDICVACNTSNSFDITASIQQQALGQIRLYYSEENNWLPTRQVWNQAGYFVVNINDDLTVPTNMVDMTLSYGTGPCLNGIPGEIMPFNTFLNQVPTLGGDGCPFFPGPDIEFAGLDPSDPTLDPTDPSYDSTALPSVVVIPPTCGDLQIGVAFNIVNSGSLVISDNLPVSFWENNPTISPDTISNLDATLLHTSTIVLSGLQVGDTLRTDTIYFNYSGEVSTLYIVLNDDGTQTIPISLNTNQFEECTLTNNIISIPMIPEPFEVYIDKVADNYKCDDTAPDNGELGAIIIQNGDTVTDYSNFSFQWYDIDGATVTALTDAEATTNYLTARDSLYYGLIVTNNDKGCESIMAIDTVNRLGVDPTITININSDQTQCSPPNGELEVFIDGGNSGFTFDWRDSDNTQIGTGAVVSNLTQGVYTVNVNKDGCTKNALQTIGGPTYPTAQILSTTHITDCSNSTEGAITAEALDGGVVQDPSEYTFNFYYYDSTNLPTLTGSILPAINGTGQTRTGLEAGKYVVFVLEDSTQCTSSLPVVTEVLTETVIPEVIITEIAPQTSCGVPNGILEATVFSVGVEQDASNFTVEWFLGDNTLAPSINASEPGRVSIVNGRSQLTQVVGGGVYHTVKVTTGFNCTDTDKLIITENQITPVITLSKTDNFICDPATAAGGAYDGSVSVASLTDANGSSWTYNWTDVTHGTDLSGQTASTSLSGLQDGIYSLSVTNDLGCTSAIVNIAVLPNITLPAITFPVETPDTRCDGTGNGTLEAFVVQTGTETYKYQWYTGTDTTAVEFANGTAINNLTGGSTYTVRVTNELTGCVSSA
ncbi:MAG: FG-GAP-like repeat-containing protein, partial [Cyclobacteriaceae bacterium]|nr:FG-GAP-like repeat-containing protein [Cyclobacteriaceae bacterium]